MGTAPEGEAGIRGFLSRRPFIAFVTLAYAWSWSFWTLEALSGGATAVVAHYSGGFGPLVAAALVIHAQGHSLAAWLKSLLHWRLAPAWYAFVIGFPVLLVIMVSALYGALGGTLDASLIPERLAAYVPTFLLLVAIGGGNEEPGWRGFGLLDLQQRHGPVVATLILGCFWALWHLPLLATSPQILNGPMALPTIAIVVGVTFLGIVAHAFWYTWAMNRTGSVLLCMLLHGGYNAANGLLLLVPEAEMEDRYLTLLLVMTSALIGTVVILVAATRGRLGRA